ncbi:long-chain fatty acid transport protein 4 [Eupeodes corollae]|uniref:long-chain fatty acid transport protein 4 n=1 Tax=Eupeodes corollae TaxID=290404 RepID=UPI00248F54BF|nr:long-chain fatty acid transport protein 4 [Eupeodes corollae]
MLVELNFKQRNATILATVLVGLGLSAIVISNPVLCVIFLGLTAFLITENRITHVYSVMATLPRDVTAATRFLKIQYLLYKFEWQKYTVPRVFQTFLQQNPEKDGFIMESKKLTFQDIEDFSNKIASYFKSKGFKREDSIALLMETRPEYSCIWMGLSKIGVVTALINSNLRKETLLHSIKAAKCKAIIFGAELSSALKEVLGDEDIKNLELYQFTDDQQREGVGFVTLDGATDIVPELKTHKATDLTKDIAEGRPKDKMVYIYTSGTTGMPKAAVITHLRYMFMAVAVHKMVGIREDDIIYNPLPLYHTAGGILGAGNVFLHGNTMVLRKKFSATNFWTDCIKYKCTVAQYIGELCRYLLSTPTKPEDTKHSIRLMFGNGLRPQIWSQFTSRFNIDEIGELYGSTEGNSNLVNVDNQVGAIGFIPVWGEKIYPVMLIRCDEDTGEPIRDSHGHCVKCKPGEPGVFIGKINPKRAVNAFSGYADKSATEKKLIRNVFQDGDVYFNSGDILVKDILGYFYFKDRMGDTFRWRGENVATSEVEAIITNVVGLEDCVVYGVDIPHVEGKAGMAGIVDPDRKVDMVQLSAGIRGSLPAYAQPLFIRLLTEMPKTATFKLKKRDLQVEGFDITKVKDPIYYLNKDGIYREMTQSQFDDIQSGKARL